MSKGSGATSPGSDDVHGLTFSDIIPDVNNANSVTTETFFGKVRSVKSLSWMEITFLIMTLLTLLTAIALTLYRLFAGADGADFTFGIVILVNECLCLYYVLSGVFFERPYELGVLVVSTGVMWLYLVLNYAISIKGPYKLARLIISSVLSPLVIVIGVLLAKNYHESKNLIFRTVGANAKMQDICNTLFIFIGLLKLDFQVSVSLAIMVLTSGRDLNLTDKVLLPIALVVAFLSILLGYLAVRKERKVFLGMYAVLLLLMPAFAIFLIVDAGQDLQDATHDPPMAIAIYVVIFVTSASCLVMRVVLLYFCVRVFLNFGKGLRQKVFGAPDPVTRPPERNINTDTTTTVGHA